MILPAQTGRHPVSLRQQRDVLFVGLGYLHKASTVSLNNQTSVQINITTMKNIKRDLSET